MDNFDKALEFILKSEGGYSNTPGDFGGETNKGITHFVYDKYRKDKKLPLQSVKFITDDEVKEIYYNRYWLANKCDKMLPSFAVMVFDTAVNMGNKYIAAFLTEAEYKYPDKFMLARIRKYKDFAMIQSQKKFLLGWLNRCFSLMDFINKDINGKF